MTEAIILDKPVVIIDLFNQTKGMEFINKEIMLCLETTEQINQFIKVYFKEYFTSEELREKREEYIKRFFYKADGKASERVAEMIRSLIQ